MVERGSGEERRKARRVDATLSLNLHIDLPGSGGPADSTRFYVLYLWQVAFERFKMGYGSAMAWFLFLVIGFVTLLQFQMANRWVYYDGE